MKFSALLLIVVASVSTAAPAPHDLHADASIHERQAEFDTFKEFIPVTRDERNFRSDGTYEMFVETGNGIVFEEVGTKGINGTIVKRGRYSYPTPNGEIFEVRYIADELGYRVTPSILNGNQIQFNQQNFDLRGGNRNEGQTIFTNDNRFTNDNVQNGFRGDNFQTGFGNDVVSENVFDNQPAISSSVPLSDFSSFSFQPASQQQPNTDSFNGFDNLEVLNV